MSDVPEQDHFRPDVHFVLGLAGAKLAADAQAVCIVVDVLRASSTITALLAHYNDMRIKPLSSLAGWMGLTVGECNALRIEGCHFNNSPSELLHNHSLRGVTELGFISTNGGPCVLAASSNHSLVLLGCVLNAKPCAQRALGLAREKKKTIYFIMAGWRGEMAEDDLLAASCIYEYLADLSHLKGAIQPVHTKGLAAALRRSKSAERLVSLGFRDDVEYCLNKNRLQVVPYFDGTHIRI